MRRMREEERCRRGWIREGGGERRKVGGGKVMVVVAVCWETKSNIQGFEFQNLIC